MTTNIKVIADTLKVGKIVGVFGLKGELKFKHFCDDFSSFANIKKLYDGCGKEYAIASLRPHKNVLLLKLLDISKIEEAEVLVGLELYAKKTDFPLGEDEFFLDDCVGFSGISEENGECFGKMKYVQQNGSKILYVFTGGIMIPEELVKDIDFTEETMTCELIEGLIDLNSKEDKA